MKILFTICARKGSKGLKNKNISNFLQYPICYYTLSAYNLFKNSYKNYECDLAVNTDSEELINQINQTNIRYTHIKRTEELAGDRVGKIDVIKDTYQKMKEQYNCVIDLDLTSPLRAEGDIYGVLNALLENKSADLGFSMTTSRRSPYFNQVKSDEHELYTLVENKGFVSRQQAPVVYDMNASIYAYKPDFLKKAVKLFDGRCAAYIMKDTAVLDIDNPEDKDLMEILAKYFYNNYPEYNIIRENIKNITE